MVGSTYSAVAASSEGGACISLRPWRETMMSLNGKSLEVIRRLSEAERRSEILDDKSGYWAGSSEGGSRTNCSTCYHILFYK